MYYPFFCEHVFISLGIMPGSAIAGLYGDCMFCLFNEIKRLLSGVAVLCMRVQVSLHHHQHLIVSFFILLVLISLWS